MTLYTVYIGLGSNLGDRNGFLNKAVQGLKKLENTRVISLSSVYATAPVGNVDQPEFLNAALEIETALGPRALLDAVKTMEPVIGRGGGERWGPREIDVDILLYDGLVFSDDRVTVPHPAIAGRKFVLVPLREIAPDLVHPVSGMTVEELAAACPDHSRVVKTTYHLQW